MDKLCCLNCIIGHQHSQGDIITKTLDIKSCFSLKKYVSKLIYG